METTKTKIISYWDQTGKFQDDYTRLWKAHVPRDGESETVEGELIRAIGRLTWDYCNNGNGNAYEIKTVTEYYTCHSCNGVGYDDEDEECDECCGAGELEEEEDGEVSLNNFFCDFICFIENHVPDISDKTLKLREFICNCPYNSCKYTQEEHAIYNDITDSIVEFVLSKEKTGFTPYKK